jgi:hypothetical protein
LCRGTWWHSTETSYNCRHAVHSNRCSSSSPSKRLRLWQYIRPVAVSREGWLTCPCWTELNLCVAFSPTTKSRLMAQRGILWSGSDACHGFLISRSPLSDTSGGRAGFTKSFLLKHRTDRPCCTVDACHPVAGSLYERG